MFENAKSFGDGAFKNCQSIETVFSNVITELKDGVFYKCISLRSANFPKVTKLNFRPFAFCENLIEVNIPLLDCIDGHSIFENCDKITELNLYNLKTIYGSPFSNMHSLRIIRIPKLEYVGISSNELFLHCWSLEKIYAGCNVSYEFDNTFNSNVSIVIPTKACIDFWKHNFDGESYWSYGALVMFADELPEETSELPSENENEEESPQNKIDTEIIIYISVGFVLGLAIIVLVVAIIYVVKRRKMRKNEAQSSLDENLLDIQ